jgi:hypothetical protein
MSMIDPKGARSSALDNVARLQQSGSLKLVKTDVQDDSDKRISPLERGYGNDINAA